MEKKPDFSKGPPWRQKVKAHAKSKKITNEDIAAHFDITAGQVSHWFKARRGIWLHEYLELCALVGLDPGEALLEGPHPPPDPKLHQEILDRLDKLSTTGQFALMNKRRTTSSGRAIGLRQRKKPKPKAKKRT